MVRYLFRQLLGGVVTLYIFLTLLFFVTQLMIPGDFASQFRLFMTGEQVAQLRHLLGLDLPIGQRYLIWLGNLLQGDLGLSFSGPPVGEILRSAVPVTLLIFSPGTVVAFMLGLWLGKVTAWRGPGLSSSATVFSSIIFYTAFPPWLAFLVAYLLARRLQLFRQLFKMESSRYLWSGSPLDPPTVMWYILLALTVGMLLVILVNRFLGRRRKRGSIPNWLSVIGVLLVPVGGGALFGILPQIIDIYHGISLPLLTYILLSFGETMLIMRTSMVDTLHEEYVLAARAKGLPDRVVRDKHAARNALLPVLSRLVTSLPYLLTGFVIIEFSFTATGHVFRQIRLSGAEGWSGIGTALFEALVYQDMPMVMSTLLLVGLLALAARLVLDVLCAYLDPRIRYGASGADRLR